MPRFSLHAVLDRFAAVVLRHRIALAVAVGLLSGLMASFAARVRTDFTIQELFAVDDPEIAYLNQVRARFGADDDLLVVLVQASNVFRPDVLRAIQRVSQQLLRTPGIRRVDSLTTISDLGASGEGTVDTRPLFHVIPDDPQSLQALRRRALASPLLRRHLVAADGSVTLIAARLAAGIERAEDVAVVVARVERLLAQQRLAAGTQVQLTGVPLVRTEAVRMVRADQRLFMPVSVTLVLVVLLLLYRSLHGVLLPLAAIGLSTVYTIGVMSMVGQPIDILSNVLPVLVMVYGVANAVHLLGRLHEQMRAGGSREQALRVSIRHLGAACLLTSATTAIGFGSLLSSDMAILRRFGLFAAVGVVIAYVLTMVILPVGVSVVRVDARRTARVTQGQRLERLLARIAALNIRRPHAIFSCGVLLAVGGAALGTQVVVDNYLLGIFKEDHPTRRATQLAERKLQGVVNAQVVLEGAPGTLQRPDVLRAIDGLERWLAEQPGVTGTMSPAKLVRELHRAVVGTSVIPASRQAVAQLLLLAEGGTESTSLGQLVGYQYAVGRVVVALQDIGAQRYLALTRQVREEIARRLGGLPVRARVTGTSMIAYRGINRLVLDLLTSLGLALVVIGLLLVLAFRSLRVALFSLVLNLIPLACGLGFMALAGMRLEPTTVMIYAIAFGIAVDDTIHFIARYREECRAGADAPTAVRTTLRTAGRSMIITSVVLIMGFAVLLTSNFPNTQRFGVLGCVILFAALVADLLITPACMLIFKPWSKGSGTSLKGSRTSR